MITRLVAAHPVSRAPYDKLVFERLDHNKVPLYTIIGVDAPAAKALEALRRAFAEYGGKCFYCPTKFKPQGFSCNGPHRDHVVAASDGGSDLLHNLVIACGHCGRTKGSDSVHDFRPVAAKAYLAALHEHIARCVREGGKCD